MRQCFRDARKSMPMAILESRMDSAFFSENFLKMLTLEKVEFTASVPFDRFAELKKLDLSLFGKRFYCKERANYS